MSLISNFSAWYVLLCIIAGLLFSGILYYKSAKDGFDIRKRWLLAGLRFLSVFLISFLLLAFLLKVERCRTEKPIVVLLHDNSESLSDFSKENPQWLSQWTDLSNDLNDKFQIEHMAFGKDISATDEISLDEKQTHIANALTQMKSQFYGQNLAAVVLASDGIYTAGEHPLSSAKNLNIPVFTVALGDTTEYKDVKIHNVNHNKYAYLGNQFPINIELRAMQCVNTNAVLTVQAEGKTVFSKDISIDKSSFFETVDCFERATKVGVQRYVISISTVQGERNIVNNRSEIFVEVLDNRRKILLLGSAPHPDISAIKQSISESERYEVDLVLDGNLPSPIENYDVAILHQLPAKTGIMQALVQQISDKKLPVWAIIGTQTELNAFNKLDFGVTVQLQGQQTNEAFPSFNSAFTSFDFSDEAQNQLYNFP
ncbi:MAG: hypothetical protein LBU68_02420, partial [Rickettsiales bacterium]|nr:hypothetical protein [Rickettsiales bacterium]